MKTFGAFYRCFTTPAGLTLMELLTGILAAKGLPLSGAKQSVLQAIGTRNENQLPFGQSMSAVKGPGA